MRDEEQQRKERQAKLLAAIERQIAYKNIEFTIAHQNDTKDELAAYLKACMDDIGHAPAKVEVIGGDLIEYRDLSHAYANTRLPDLVDLLAERIHDEIPGYDDPADFREDDFEAHPLAELRDGILAALDLRRG